MDAPVFTERQALVFNSWKSSVPWSRSILKVAEAGKVNLGSASVTGPLRVAGFESSLNKGHKTTHGDLGG